MANIVRSPIWPDPRVQPPFGAAEANYQHTLARGLNFAVLVHGTPKLQTIFRGQRRTTLINAVATGNPVLSGTRFGSRALRSPDTSTYWDCGVDGTHLTLPTTAVTVAVIRRKLDTTARASALFGTASAGATTRLGTHCPWSDGVVYWDFGGTSGANRISYTWAATTTVERFVFVAGTRGSAIYLDGISKASQATGITRSSASEQFFLNAGQGSVSSRQDIVEYVAFFLFDAEWTQDQARQWTAEPYCFLQPIIRRRYFVPAAGGATWPGWFHSRGGWTA